MQFIKITFQIFIRFQQELVSCTLMAEKVSEPIQFIMKSEIGGVLTKAFAELYRARPNFPVSYLANWLKDYSKTQLNKKLKVENVQKNMQQFRKLQEADKHKKAHIKQAKQKQQEKLSSNQKQYRERIENTKHLQDLLIKWLPNYIENRYQLSGAYVGNLTYPRKKLQPGNFQPGAQLDAQSPKIIEYIGASDSQEKIIFMKILSNQQGVSFECFNEPEPQPPQQQVLSEGQDPKPPKQPKKTYIFVPDVTKNQKVHYFKFPKLGSYACFPLKLKSYLTESGFEQVVTEYKEFIKRKQQNEKDHLEQINDARVQYEEAKKKFEEFQVPEEQPTSEQIQQKKYLEQQAKKFQKVLEGLQNTPPKVEQPNFPTLQKSYLLGCDTLGQDKPISQKNLDEIDQKAKYFKKKFQQKQKQMILHDILAFIDQQHKLDPLQLLYKQHQKNATAASEQVAKQKNIKDKELEFEISAGKVKKMDSIFDEPSVQKSMKTYLSYNTPKYKQVLQIALMFLGYKAHDINLSRSNTLDFRKVTEPKFVEQFMKKLSEFDVKPLHGEACPEQYKINKLLQRLQKVDLDQLIRYNGFIWVLANHIKSYCWTLILCRDAKKQAYETSVKICEDKNAQIEKYKQQRQKQRVKALQAAKSELNQQTLATFNQEEWSANWLSNYSLQVPEPLPIEPIKLQEYLNID